MFWPKDDRHPGVDLGDELIGFTGDNCAMCSHLSVAGSFQPSQRPAKTKDELSFIPIE